MVSILTNLAIIQKQFSWNVVAENQIFHEDQFFFEFLFLLEYFLEVIIFNYNKFDYIFCS